jgi:ADP-heptose:LPS heptosyltransferase
VFVSEPPDLSQLSDILVVKLDEIGDFILSTPFLRGLRASSPRASIWLATSPIVAALARSCPHVDHALATNDANFRATVEQHGFDLAVVPRFDFDRYSASFVAKQSRAARIFGFSERCTPLKAAHNRGFDLRYYTDVLVHDAAAHEVEHNLALLDYLGGCRHGDAVELTLSAADRSAGARLVEEAAARLRHSRVLAVAPGSSYPAKELPVDALAPIAAAAAEAIDAGIVVLGTAPQAAQGRALAERLGGRAVNLCGQLPLAVAASVVSSSAAVISMCSAGGHLAAAFGRPVVVFSCHPRNGDPGHFHSPVRFRPWAPPSLAMVVQPDEPLARASRPARRMPRTASPT